MSQVHGNLRSENKLARTSSLAARCALLGLFAAVGALSTTQAVAVPPPSCDDPAIPTSVVTSPTAGSSFHPAPQTLVIGASSTGGVRVRTDYYANGTAIGQATAAPWTITWSNVPAGTYSLQARSLSKTGTCLPVTGPLSSPVSITVAANQAPSVGIIYPTNNSTFLYPATVPLSVSASDGDGSVTGVQYFANGAAISGTVGGAPGFNFAWSGMAPGTYSVTAVATDNDGGQSSSSPVSVTLHANVAPSVGITGPANGTASNAPGSFNFTAGASDSDGSVASVQWFANGNAISGALTSAPYAFTWSGVGAGSYSITAKATDNNGAVTTSAPITVVSNDAPSVTLNPGAVNTTAPGSIVLQASASDGLGGVSSVQYFANGSAISGVVTGAPYAFTWGGVGAGSYSIVARVTDVYGATTNSAPYSLTVYPIPPPSASVLSPADGAVYAPGASLQLAAGVTVNGNTVNKVEFYDGASFLGQATLSNGSYVLGWPGIPNGSHGVTAKVTDSFGRVTTSAVASIAVIVPTIPTPPNLSGPVAGTLTGKASVSPSGASTYAVSIPVPPGTAGLAPTIDLVYSSQAGTGMSGLGWSLNGLSTITRCAKTVAQDGVRSNVSLTATDQFCLDGQRLMLVNGTHGVNAEYRTEVDRFSRVVSFGSDPAKGPDRWAVTTKAGITMNYGATVDSNIEAQGTSPTVILTWALSSMVDPRGNTVSYSYAKNSAIGEYVPSQITYTSNATTTPALAPYNAVRFEYQARPDPVQAYVMGSKLSTTQRLTAVRTYTNTAGDGSGGTVVRQFLVTYTADPNTAKSLIQSIQDCDASGTCLPATTFAWTQRSAADNTEYGPGSGNWGGMQVQVSALHTTTDVRGKVRAVDMNGDGRLDLVTSTGDGNWQVCLSTGVNFNCQTWAGPAISYNASDSEDYAFNHVLFGDFNGDGRTDIAIIPAAANQDTSWTVCYSTGSSFNCQSVVFWSAGFQTGSGYNPSMAYHVADFDGDGRDDMLGISMITTTTPYTYVYKLCKPTGSGFTCADYGGVAPIFSTSGDVLQGDFNGDGKTDFVKRTGIYPTDAHNTWTVYLAGPTGFAPGFSAMSASPVRDNRISSSGPFFGSPKDLNGDPYGSYVDLLTTWIGGAELCRSTGKSLDCTVATGLNEYDSTLIDAGDFDGDGKVDVLSRYNVNYTTTPGKLRLCQVGTGAALAYGPCVDYTGDGAGMLTGDFNGDGLLDRAYYGSGGWSIRLAGGTRPQLLSRVTNGYGAATEFSYKLLTDDSVYTRDSGTAAATYPQRDVRDTTAVVSEMRADNALGAWLTTDFKYGGLKADLAGRGTLGFRWLEAYDATTHVTTRSEFSQTFPHIGRSSRIVWTHDSGVELKRVETSFAQTTTASGGSVFSYVSGQTETTKNLNGAAMATTTTTLPPTGAYDTFGNLLSQTVVVVAGGETFTTATANTYDNLPANWQIGLERQTQVTKGAPGVSSVTRTVAKDYDSYGNLLRETLEPSAPTLKLTTESTRDQFGNVTKTTLKWTDPVSATSQQRDTATNTYDTRGRWPVKVANALNQSETRDYAPGTGGLTTLIGPNGLTTTTQYDGWGRKTLESRADGGATTWGYRQCVDSCSGAANVTIRQELFGETPIAVATETFADRIGRTIQTRTWGFDGTAILAQQQYDGNGRLSQSSRPYQASATPVWTTFGYDDLGRKTSVTEPSASGGTQQSTIAYDGLVATLTNPKSQTKTKLRNGLGLVRQITDAMGNSTNYLYDPFGNLVRTTDMLGNAINVVYDTLGRKTQLVDPDLGTWTYFVDPLGQTYRQTDAKQQATKFVFDDLGRMIQRLEPDLDSRWVFDTASKGVGKLAEAYTRRGDGSKDYRRVHTYDALSRPSSTTLSLDQDYLTSIEYDAYGRVFRQTYVRNATGGSGGPGNAVESGYNSYGYGAQTRSTTTSGGKIESKLLVRDAEGRAIREAYGNGLVTDRRYNAYVGTLDRLTTGSDNGSGGDTASVQSDTYQYDSLNNLRYRAQLTDSSGGMLQESFDYDPLNRVTSSQVAGLAAKAFAYDAIGNLTSRTGVGTYIYPSSGASSVRPHAVSGITGAVDGLNNPTLGYDDNGNTLSGIGRNTTWTAANLPATVSRTNAVTGVSVTATFVYGPEHQRIKQSLSTGVTLYYAEGTEKEVSPSGTRIKTYLPGDLGYIEESTANPAPATRYFHNDHLGSVIAVSDSSGVVLERLSYDVWGQRRNPSGSDDANYALKGTQDRTGYTGQEHLDELDLVHLNGRVYDPIIGRFTSADPNIPDPTNHQSFNRYSYVLNNPLAYTDPSGFMMEEVTPSNTLEPGTGSGTNENQPPSEDGSPAPEPKPDKKKEEEKKKKEDAIKKQSCASSVSPAACTTARSQMIADAAKVSGQIARATQDLITGGYSSSTAEAIAKGQYGWATVYTVAGAGYGVMFFLTAGESAAILNTAKTLGNKALGAAATADVTLANSAAKGVPPLRQAYVDAVSELKPMADSLRAAGADTEQIARALHAERRALGEQFKALTPADKLGEIYSRNIEKYGDKLGPTVEWLRARGKSWDQIIESATRTGGKDLGF